TRAKRPHLLKHSKGSRYAHAQGRNHRLRGTKGPTLLRPSREATMLVLTRKSNQSIMIGDDIEVSVLAIMGEKVRIGIQAPRDVPVFRKEVYLEIQDERRDGMKPHEIVVEVEAALQEL